MQRRSDHRRSAAARPLLLPLFVAWALAACTLPGRAVAEGLYTPKDGILEIKTKEDLEKAFLSSHGPGLLEFYIPSCPHCINLVPDMRKAAKALAGIATVGAVDCTDADARALCSAHVVHGFPTLKLFAPDLRPNPYVRGEAMKENADYAGPRGARALAAAVTNLLHPKHLGKVETEEDLAKFAPAWAAARDSDGDGSKQEGGADGLARVLLFTDKTEPTVLAKALSTAFAGRLKFAQAVKANAGAAAAALGVGEDDYPVIVVIRQDGTTERYEGELKAPPLREFLEPLAAPAPALPGQKRDGGKGGDADDTAGLMDKLMAVTVERLTPGNLTALDADELAWVLAVYSSSGDNACKAELEQFNATARAAQAVVRYGALDAASALGGGDGAAEAAAALKEVGVDVAALAAAPCALQVVLLPFGAGKAELAEYQRYTGPLDDGKALQAWALADAPDTTALLASDAELRAFIAPLPGAGAAGRVVLFASKAEAPAVYRALALNSAARGDGFAFGWIPAGADEAFAAAARAMLRVERAPALLAAVPMPEGAAAVGDAGGNPAAPSVALQPYPGPLKYAVMSAWLVATARVAGISKEALARAAAAGGGPGAAAGAAAALAPLSTNEELTKRCYEAGTALCLIAVVDARSAKLPDWTAALKDAAAASKARNPSLASFVTVDGPRQPRLLSALGLSQRDLPAIAAVSAKRLRFALAPPHAKFGAPAVSELLAGVMAGKIPTAPLDELPELVAAGDGGDEGADQQQQQQGEEEEEDVEDEFDLSEVMGVEGVEGLESKEAALKRAEEELAAEAAAAAAAKKEAEEAAAAAAAAAKKKKQAAKKKKKATAADHDEL